MNKRLRQKLRKRRHQLWRAVQADDLRRVRKLLRLGAGDISALLEDACVYASPEMLDLLRRTAGMSAEKLLVSRLSQAIEDDDAAAVQQCLAAGAGPDAELDRHGSRPLHKVRSAAVARLLLAAGADVHATSRYGDVPIFFGSAEVVEVLLAAGADATVRGRFGQAALLGWREPAAIRMLLAAGADTHAVRVSGDTVLHEVYDAEAVRIFAGLGVDVNACDCLGNTPLFHAHKAPVVQALLDAGADPRAVNDDGETPLHHCMRADCAALLLAAGADAMARDKEGLTPLDHARRRNHRFNGSRPDARDLELMAVLQKNDHCSGN